MCSTYGDMHGGTFDDLGDWAGGGYPQVFPSALSLSNTTGVTQTVFPHSAEWVVDNRTTGTRGILRAWVNGWYTSFWEVDAWHEAESYMELGKGYWICVDCPDMPRACLCTCIHTQTHTHTYIYVCVFVCVCKMCKMCKMFDWL